MNTWDVGLRQKVEGKLSKKEVLEALGSHPLSLFAPEATPSNPKP